MMSKYRKININQIISFNRFFILFLITGLLASCGSSAPEINVYSSRHYEIDDKIFEQFTEKTGIRVNLIKANADQLIRRIELEGEFSPADVIITSDAVRMVNAGRNGLLQEIPPDIWKEKLQNNYVDPEGKWIAFTARTRVIMFNKNVADTSGLSNYEDLILPQFNNKLLVRSSENVYNQSLAASILYHHGEGFASEWANGIVGNMSRSPRGNDTDQIKGVISGAGQIAIANSYYLAKLHNSPNPEEVRLADNIGILFPNQQSTGTHVNFSTVGLVKHARNKENATKLIDFLLSDEIQEQLMLENYEYHVSNRVEISGFLKKWEPYKRDTLHLEEIANAQSAANRILHEAGWR